jgi:Coenzyme PQQ synthesis protein D (PqqD)
MTSSPQEVFDDASTGQTRHQDPLSARAKVPQHVVYREFAHETVVLNLQTGTYHGLNQTAGLMLDALSDAPNVREAASVLAVQYGWELATVEQDMIGLCETLAARGLIELVDNPPEGLDGSR